jgi:hypothetical protein
VLRRALAALLVSTVVVAGATTPVKDRLRGPDGGHLWPGSSQLALTHGARSDLQTLQEVRTRGKLTAAGLPDFLASGHQGLASPLRSGGKNWLVVASATSLDVDGSRRGRATVPAVRWFVPETQDQQDHRDRRTRPERDATTPLPAAREERSPVEPEVQHRHHHEEQAAQLV